MGEKLVKNDVTVMTAEASASASGPRHNITLFAPMPMLILGCVLLLAVLVCVLAVGWRCTRQLLPTLPSVKAPENTKAMSLILCPWQAIRLAVALK